MYAIRSYYGKTNESKTTIVALPNVDNEKQSEIKKSEANGEKNVVEQKKTTKPVTQTDEITHKESSDNNWNSEVEKNGCDFTVITSYSIHYTKLYDIFNYIIYILACKIG